MRCSAVEKYGGQEDRAVQDEVREAALRLLDYQDRSAGELRDRLKKKSYSAEDVEETVRALQECGLVDDRRYASVFAQSKIAAGKGRNYIVGKLREKKVSAEIVETVIEELMEEEDELLLCLKKPFLYAVCRTGLKSAMRGKSSGERIFFPKLRNLRLSNILNPPTGRSVPTV